MKVVFDINIIIDYLNGNELAKKELAAYSDPIISIITWMEVLVGAESEEENNIIKNFLERFELAYVDTNIAELAVNLRKLHNIKLPDAIIWATAQHNKCLLITRDLSSIAKNNPSIKIPY